MVLTSSSTLDSRCSRQAERIVSAGQTAFDRIYRTFIGARAALGVALVLAQAVTGLFGARPSLEAALVSVAYGALALSLWLLPRKKPIEPKALARVSLAGLGWPPSVSTWWPSARCTC